MASGEPRRQDPRAKPNSKSLSPSPIAKTPNQDTQSDLAKAIYSTERRALHLNRLNTLSFRQPAALADFDQ